MLKTEKRIFLTPTSSEKNLVFVTDFSLGLNCHLYSHNCFSKMTLLIMSDCSINGTPIDVIASSDLGINAIIANSTNVE